MHNPQRLTPSLREKVWGRKRLAPWFADSSEPVGEVWYEAACELPLLVKLLFTSERLSIQVHPDDGEGVPRGKTEMWHILEAEPGARIALGFREPVTPLQLAEACSTGEIEELVNWFPVKPGETYFTPAHTVHAIGAGIVLCEIQQNSDVTYRLWDYGRPRELHLEQGLRVSHTGVHPGPVEPTPLSDGHDLLVRSHHFVTESLRLLPGATFAPTREACQLLICVEGRGTVGVHPISPGEVWFLPAESHPSPVRAETPMRLLRSYAP
ncbi:MAG: class I mannose-6-phosphate isomerase [Acidobacteriia bacterium]|nr:class I mannose-6-phosphate isomerase [Terriglobia bacterium]MBV9742768.1 class I mannose-6-phosphate isomerase [Terriglobia bacterium]